MKRFARRPRAIPIALVCILVGGHLYAGASAARAAEDAHAPTDLRLAQVEALEVSIEAEDFVSSRTFQGRLTYARPDRALLVVGDDGFVHLAGGTASTRRGTTLRRCDVAAWLAAAESGLAPAFAGLAGTTAAAGAQAPLPKLGEARTIELYVDVRRLRGEVGIAIGLSYTAEADASVRGLRFRFGGGERAAIEVTAVSEQRVTLRCGAVEAVLDALTGVPERVRLLDRAGKLEAEVRFTSARVTKALPEALLAMPGEVAGAVEASGPAPRTEERFQEAATRAIARRLAAAAEADPKALGEAALKPAAASCYAAVLRASFSEELVRREARAAARADAPFVRQAIGSRTGADRERLLAELDRRFRQSCRVEAGVAARSLVEKTERALDGFGGTPAKDEARKRVLLLASEAISEAFRDVILEPMATAAKAEVEAILAEPSSAGR